MHVFLFVFLQPWESQLFCSTFPYEIVCADSWGQSLLAATDAAGVMLLDGEVNPNQYLPLSSKIKPPIHNRSILHSSERQKQQQHDKVGNDIMHISGPDPVLPNAGKHHTADPR